MLTLVPALAAEVTTNITTQQIVTLLIGTIAPIVVGLITKASTSGQVKAILLVTISVLTGIGQGFLDNPPDVTWDWQQAVLSAFTAWVVGVATYYGLWKVESKDGNSVAKFAARTLVKDAA